jgi:hypothetical protein
MRMPRFVCTFTYATKRQPIAVLTITRQADNAQQAIAGARTEFDRRTRGRARDVMVEAVAEGSPEILAIHRDQVLVLWRDDGASGEDWAVVASHDRLALIARALDMIADHGGCWPQTPIDLLRTDGVRVAAASGPNEFYIAPLEMIP